MKKEKFFKNGKKLTASFLAAVLTVSTASVLPSFADEDQVDLNKLYATGCVLDSKEVMEEHAASDEQIYDLDFIDANDSDTKDVLIGVCKAAKIASLPSKIDLSSKFPAVRTQGSQGSCTAWATAYYMKTYQEAVEHNWSLSDDKHIFSPSYVYNQINNGVDKGSYISDAMDLFVNKGVCSLNTMQYNEYDYTTQPNASQNDMASNYKGYKNSDTDSWNSIHDVDAIKNYLANGQAVVVSMPTTKDLDNLNSSNPVFDTYDPNAMDYEDWLKLSYTDRQKTDYYRGNHALCLVGYDENYSYNGKTTKAFKFVNSWTSSWGLGGYGYVDEETFKSFHNNYIWAYVVNDKSHKDTNEFFTNNPQFVKAKKDIRAYKSPDYFVSSTNKDNYAYTISKDTIIEIKEFVGCEKGQQPYFVTADGYYINAQKDSLVETVVEKNIINGDQNNNVCNYNNSETSQIIITPNSSEKFNNHNTLKIDYTVNQSDSYNGYAGAKVNTDNNISVSGAKGISFKYKTPAGQNGTVALCMQGSVSKKIVELSATNGEWQTYCSSYDFSSSNISDIEIYINGNENDCETNPSSGTIYLAELSLVYDLNSSYSFKISGDDGCSIDGDLSGTYKNGEKITVTANVEEGYKFLGWSKTKGGSIISTDSTYTFEIGENTTLYANVKKLNSYKLTLVNCNSEGGTVSGSTNGQHYEGTTVNAYAYTNVCYEFKGWSKTENGPIVSTSIYYSFPITEDTTLYAHFEKLDSHTVEVVYDTDKGSAIVSGGGIRPTGITKMELPVGSGVSFVAMPKSGYYTVGWYDNPSFSGTPLSTKDVYSVTIDRDMKLYIKFDKIPEYKYTINFNVALGGVTSTLGSHQSLGVYGGTCPKGTKITVTAKASSGYKFVGWYDNSSYTGTPLSTDSTYTFTVNGETNIYAKFDKIPEYIYRVIFKTSQGMVDYSQGNMYIQGIISGSCLEGTDITVTAKPNANYQFIGWCEDSFDSPVISTSATYTFTVNKETNIFAKFAEKTDDSNILIKGVSNNVSDWTNANDGSYLNITSGSSDYLYNGEKTLKLDYNINTNDQYGGYAGRTVSLESTYANDSSKGYNGIGFWYMTPSDFNGQIALCLQSTNGLDDLVQLPSTNGEWKYYFYQTDKTNLSDMTFYINGSKNGYTTTSSNGIAKGTLYMANIEVAKK